MEDKVRMSNGREQEHSVNSTLIELHVETGLMFIYPLRYDSSYRKWNPNVRANIASTIDDLQLEWNPINQ